MQIWRAAPIPRLETGFSKNVGRFVGGCVDAHGKNLLVTGWQPTSRTTALHSTRAALLLLLLLLLLLWHIALQPMVVFAYSIGVSLCWDLVGDAREKEQHT